jgi:gas vesicle protein
MLKSFIAGAAVGAAAVYLTDPEKGAERRARVLRMWQENRDDIHQAVHTTGSVIQTAARATGDTVAAAGDVVKVATGTSSKAETDGSENASGKPPTSA